MFVYFYHPSKVLRKYISESSTSMSLHAIVGYAIPTLSAFMQLEFQSKSSSPFDTHYWTMLCFFIALFAYMAAWAKTSATAHGGQPCFGSAASNICVMSGALASVLLLKIVVPPLGWVAVALWTLCLLHRVCELAFDALIKLVDVLSRAIHGQFHCTKADELPV